MTTTATTTATPTTISAPQGLTAAAAHFGLPCICPPAKYCTDNGVMVAWTGVERLRLGLCRPPPPLDMVGVGLVASRVGARGRADKEGIGPGGAPGAGPSAGSCHP